MDASSFSGLRLVLPREEAGVFRLPYQGFIFWVAPCSSLELVAGRDTPPTALAQSAHWQEHPELATHSAGAGGAASQPSQSPGVH